jgi:hypothetical protein
MTSCVPYKYRMRTNIRYISCTYTLTSHSNDISIIHLIQSNKYVMQLFKPHPITPPTPSQLQTLKISLTSNELEPNKFLSPNFYSYIDIDNFEIYSLKKMIILICNFRFILWINFQMIFCILLASLNIS